MVRIIYLFILTLISTACGKNNLYADSNQVSPSPIKSIEVQTSQLNSERLEIPGSGRNPSSENSPQSDDSQREFIVHTHLPSYKELVGEMASINDIKTSKDNKNCIAKIGGSWLFGLIPYGCAMPEKHRKQAVNKFREFAIFPLSQHQKTEKIRYVSLMHDFIRSNAQDYMVRREPDVSEEDMQAWLQLVFSVAHQESYWTHYRLGEDQLFRIAKGDNFHGIGLMQIDIRWHKEMVKSGEIYDLESNLLYSMDLLYSARQRVLRKPCRPDDEWVDLNRSIYGRYNGGAPARCRWLQPQRKWHRNDRGFYRKYLKQTWEDYLEANLQNEELEKVAFKNTWHNNRSFS